MAGAGMALVLEGLALALAPRRLEELALALARMPVEARRTLGLLAILAGTVLVWLARAA